MEKNEKTVIDMEFVDQEEEQKDEEATELAKVEEKKPGIFRRVIHVATTPLRWIGRKIKESPASAAIGMVGGAALGYGVKAAIGHFGKKGDFIPADPPEIEIPDDGEEYVSSESSYGSTED